MVWFRRDLRADDHAALYHALRAARQVWCVFVFDRDILAPLPRQDRRVEFIRDSLVGLDAQLRALAASHGVDGVRLIVRHGAAVDEIAALATQLAAEAVFVNHDDDPAALARDAHVRGALADIGVALHSSKDHVIFERDEVLTLGGNPFSVFTPYKNAWLKTAERLLPEGLSGGAPCQCAGAAAARTGTRAADAGRRSVSSPATCTR